MSNSTTETFIFCMLCAAFRPVQPSRYWDQYLWGDEGKRSEKKDNHSKCVSQELCSFTPQGSICFCTKHDNLLKLCCSLSKTSIGVKTKIIFLKFLFVWQIWTNWRIIMVNKKTIKSVAYMSKLCEALFLLQNLTAPIFAAKKKSIKFKKLGERSIHNIWFLFKQNWQRERECVCVFVMTSKYLLSLILTLFMFSWVLVRSDIVIWVNSDLDYSKWALDC